MMNRPLSVVRISDFGFDTMSQSSDIHKPSYISNCDRSIMRFGAVIVEIIVNNTDILPTAIVVPAGQRSVLKL